MVREVGTGKTEGIAKFQADDLIVKYGHSSRVPLYEALVTKFARQQLGTKVPVPEVFGWRVEGAYVYIYQSLIRGQTLGFCWDSRQVEEKVVAISDQLGGMIAALRRMKQDPACKFVGSAFRGPVQDMFFRGESEAGPFPDVTAYNNWIQFLASGGHLAKSSDPYLHLLDNANEINFTHSDLHLENIIIAGPKCSRYVAGIIDWRQPGWYPEYWEYCKMHLGVDCEHEWRASGWIERTTTAYEAEGTAIFNYWDWQSP